MLPRVLEPEVMNSAEEARDYDAMDHSAVNRLFAAGFLAAWNGRNPILDLGTGTAQIPIEICRQSPRTQVVGLELAEPMLLLGRMNVDRAGLADRVRLELGDAKAILMDSHSFGAIISNSLIHHIPEPARALSEMVRLLAPGGVLFVRDLLRPPDHLTVERLVVTYAGDENAHQQQMFADSLRAALTLSEIRNLVATVGFDQATVQQTSDRHWTWSAVE